MNYMTKDMNGENKNNKLPEWFNGQLYSAGDFVENPYTGVKVKLTAEELSMYDFIKGAELVLAFRNKNNIENIVAKSVVNDMRKGLDWFRKTNINAYYDLLD
jgi:hypothetical protein